MNIEYRMSNLECRILNIEYRILDIGHWKLNIGGTWTYELREQDGGTLVTVTEDGEICNPFFRVMSKLVFGYHRTQESYLNALGQKFGEEVTVERLR